VDARGRCKEDEKANRTGIKKKEKSLRSGEKSTDQKKDSATSGIKNGQKPEKIENSNPKLIGKKETVDFINRWDQGKAFL